MVVHGPSTDRHHHLPRVRGLGYVCVRPPRTPVTAGGTLLQHVPDSVGHQEHSPGPDSYGTITVHTTAGSRLASIIGPEVIVSCHHHQAVDEHPEYLAAAHSTDGVLEAMESPGDRFRLAVQWHPETRTDRQLFDALVSAAGAR